MRESQSATPPPIEDAVRSISELETEIRVLERESAIGGKHGDRIATLQAELQDTAQNLAALRERHQREMALLKQLIELRETLENSAKAATEGKDASKIVAKRAQMAEATSELTTMQGEMPLLRVCVDAQVVADVISGWTGIPVGKMLKDEIQTVLHLKNLLEERVVGQSYALDAIAQRIRTARAGLDDPGRPVGVFLLVGPSGVGKTETALALADLLYGGEKNTIVINMSEYQEAHTVSGLKGSPPGYVGYGEGGVLTEAVRHRPYSVVLLDEMEKAHPDVMELFYQVFDKG